MGHGGSSVLPPGPLPVAEVRALVFAIRLRDGRRVMVRPISPDDARWLQDGLTRMGWQLRLFRFHRRLSRLGREQLRCLAAVDQHSHVAWGALSLDEAGMPGVGVARYAADPEDAGSARVVVTVIDRYQGVGLGRALLEMLRLTAHENGVTRLIGHTFPENAAGRRLFTGAGGVETGRTASGLITMEIHSDGTRSVRSSNKQPHAKSAAADKGDAQTMAGW